MNYRSLYQPIHADNLFRYGECNHGLRIYKKIENQIPKKPQKIIEIGCGNGKFCNLLAEHGHKVVGVDVTDGPYNREKYEFVEIDITQVPWQWADNEFDVAFCLDVLEHLEERSIPPVIAEICRISKKQYAKVAHYAMSDPRLHLTVKPEKWWTQMFEDTIGVADIIWRDTPKGDAPKGTLYRCKE